MCRISFPVCLLKTHFWLPGETVVNFTLSVPWASRRQEALCVSALSSLSATPPSVFSYPCLNYPFFHVDIDFKTLHRCHLPILYWVPTLYKTWWVEGHSCHLLSALVVSTLLIHQPRHLRQLGDDSVYRQHSHLQLRRVRLERKAAPHCMAHLWCSGQWIPGVREAEAASQVMTWSWWQPVWHQSGFAWWIIVFKPSFREFCLPHGA